MLSAAATVLVFAEYVGTLDLSNRTEMRVRHTQDVVPDKSFDLTDAPTARLALRDHRWDHRLGYSMLAVLPDAQAGISPQLMQLADVSTGWHDRRVRLGVAEYVSYGVTNSGYLVGGPAIPTAPPATPPPGPAPTPVGPTPPAALTQPASLSTGSSRTALNAALQLSRRLVATSTVEYSVGGGVDDASRAVLPIIRGPRAEGSATYTVTRLDALESRVGVQRTTTTAGPCSVLLTNVPANATCAAAGDTAQVTEAWLRRLNRTSTATLAGGASLGHLRLREEDPYITRVYPVVRAGFVHERAVEEIHTLLRVDAQLAPIIDIRTGLIDQRAQATVLLSLPIERVTLIGSFSGMRSVTSPFVRPTTGLQGFFEAAYRLDRHVSLGAGGQYAWQVQAGQPSFAGGAAFVQATFRTSQVRF